MLEVQLFRHSVFLVVIAIHFARPFQRASALFPESRPTNEGVKRPNLRRANDLESRIIGGTNALRSRFPYFVSLTGENISNHYCGGTLIASDVVLTAAHCNV